MSTDDEIAFALVVAKLLESYDQEAIECLAQLNRLLLQLIEDDKENSNSNTSGIIGVDIGSVVTQTMSLETGNADLQNEGAKVLQHLALIEGQFEFPCDGVATLCNAMSHHPQHEGIQESACTAICRRLTKNAVEDYAIASIDILDTVLPAIKTYFSNPDILCSGLNILGSLAFKNPVIQSQMTDTISLIFKALKQKNSQVRREACGALAGLAKGHPTNQELIAKQLSLILDTMRLHSQDVGIQETAFSLLANLAAGPSSRHTLLAKGGLDCLLTGMTDNWQHVGIQVTGCQAVANLFAGVSDDIKAKGISCIKTTLKAMRLHASEPQIQFYGCCALRNLSRMLHAAVAQAGGMATIVIAMRDNLENPALQEQACAALYNLLSNGTIDDIFSLASEGGISTLLQVLKQYPKRPQVQQQGLGALAFLSTRKANNQETIMMGKGLHLVFTALMTHGTNSEIAKHGCDVLQNLTLTPDFQRAVVAKNGLKVLLTTMRRQEQNVPVQLYGISSLRNLCLNRDNLRYVATEGGIVTSLATMRNHPNHASIQAYSCETLSHLATQRQTQIVILAKNGIVAVMQTMETHPEHVGVQEQGCRFLANMSRCHEAAVWMKNYGAIDVIQAAEKQLPRRSQARRFATDLAKRLQTTKLLMSKSMKR